MKLRAAVARDIDALDRIALRAKSLWGYTAEQLAAWQTELRTAPDSLAIRPTLVAAGRGQIVAFGQLDPATQPWELAALWVLPTHMDQGIGWALLRRLVATAAAAGQSELRIDADPNALGFYLARGARHVADVAAPITGNPGRYRPQLLLSTAAA
jgi:predicted N-acetyltransferase YhbS